MDVIPKNKFKIIKIETGFTLEESLKVGETFNNYAASYAQRS